MHHLNDAPCSPLQPAIFHIPTYDFDVKMYADLSISVMHFVLLEFRK